MIEKITDHNLERYDSRLKEWCDRKFFEKGNYGKYQTTEESSTVSFYPVPNTPLEGKVKFNFKETMPVSGDKGPNNPSTIIGVNSIKVIKCGKNLLKFLNYSSNTINGVTCSADSNGIITLDGTASADASFQQYFNPTMRLDSDTTVLCSYEIVSGSYTPPTDSQVAFYVRNIATKTGSIPLYLNISNVGMNDILRGIPSGYMFSGSNVFVLSGASFNNLKLKVQTEFGNVKTPWESPNFFDYNLSLGNTYYGGEIDLATGVMIVTHVCVELKGTETWENITGYNSSTGLGYSRCYPESISGKKSSIDFPNFSDPSLTYKFYACSHFPVIRMFSDIPIQNGTLTTPCMWYTAGTATQNGQARFAVPFSNVADLKAWLAAQKTAGTPVMLTYKIYEPFIVQLSSTEILSLVQIDKYTPKLNTIYTDADSIQIAYLKSPIRDEYEKTQAILSLGGNS